MSAAPDLVFRAQDLAKVYRMGEVEVRALAGVDIDLVQGELLVLTGFVLVVGFAVDIVHRLIDPRQREAT